MEASERRILAQEASSLGVTLSGDQRDRLDVYADLLRLWNRRVRLLGDREPEALIRKHIPDCLALLSVLPEAGPVADVGSGAGLPGLVLACARPDLDLWLVESRVRRVSFLHEATARIGLDRVEVLASRIEHLALEPRFAGRARMITGRAISAEVLVSHGLPLLAPEGRFALMQSQKSPVEGALRSAGPGRFEVAEVREYRLSTGEGRRIVLLARA